MCKYVTRLTPELIYVNTDVLYTPGMSRSARPFALARLFRALADSTRLRLLNLIAGREICVCYFVGVLRVSQPKISRHLAYLRRVGLVSARREGKWMHYRLAVPDDPAAAAILRGTLEHVRQLPELQRDLARLDFARGALAKFVTLQRAPQPSLIAPQEIAPARRVP